MISYRLTGEIPPNLCNGAYDSLFGCDAVMCKPGQFSPAGQAGKFGPCVDCPDTENNYLGQTSCASTDYLVGDLDGDGTLSDREVLHLLFTYTDGFEWGHKYQVLWTDIESPPCELPGIICQHDKVAQINLTDANMCTGNQKNHDPCIGLPSEMGLLSELKSLHLKGGSRLKGSIPDEFASLKKLEFLSLENSALSGSIDHLLKLESLRVLNLQNCGLSGTLPPFGSSHKLQALNLALNEFDGSIPHSYGHMSNLQELILVSYMFR